MWWQEIPLNIHVVITQELVQFGIFFVILGNTFTHPKEGIRNSKKGIFQKLIFKGKYRDNLRNFQRKVGREVGISTKDLCGSCMDILLNNSLRKEGVAIYWDF